MHRNLKLLSAVCALALTACAAQPQGQYQTPPRPMIEPLPPDLQLTGKDWQLCRRWLQRFSATEQMLRDSCGDISVSSNGLRPAGH